MHQMAALSPHRFSVLTAPSSPNHTCRLNPPSPNVLSFPLNQPIPSNHTKLSFSKLHVLCAIGGGDGNDGFGRTGGGGGGRGDGDDSDSKDRSSDVFGFLGLLLTGWRDRVAADPQFPFKVLMEELVGVTACVVGDMASRPNFGLNELDFVFSTLVVGSIMNFTIMYLLAPKASASSSSLPSIFANCPQSHMFEPGGYTLMSRLGTAVFKGAVFAAVGFGAGLVGTAISNGLIKLRKKIDPTFETPNKPPPTLLNAVTWAAHMGTSSNLRYQTLNGIEFLLEKGVPPVVFKSSVVVLRCLNNVIGGMSFVILARMTGSQSVAEKPAMAEIGSVASEKEKLGGGWW
ncbi:putative zinc transporter [Hibiscus syriacus]|uniref:Zinc transporter n=1 Tax=Hibiscus syriacus TaxID=106335 RepID=A0A6A3CRI6_HIBSY|nr:protein RETICULATA-RELATED 3, chloroplastic-like [Hibiscus syriacus]KAE8731833.1 putative zinc transporter [Hibiscus syriacus]